MSAPTASGPRPRRNDTWRRWHLTGLTALTAYSTAVGWQAQFVSYPFFASVPADTFPAYHQQYNQAIPGVVIAPGFLTFLACSALPWTRPRSMSRRLAAAVALTSGAGGLVTTLAWAIPLHDRLDRTGQDAATIASLLHANLARSVLLTVGTLALVVATARTGHRRPAVGEPASVRALRGS